MWSRKHGDCSPDPFGLQAVTTTLSGTHARTDGYAVRGLFVAVLRTESPVLWPVRRQAVLARIVQRGLLCCVPLPQVETAMRTSRQRREESMHLLRFAASSRQAEEAVCPRPR